MPGELTMHLTLDTSEFEAAIAAASEEIAEFVRRRKLFVVTRGSGDDGDERDVLGIFSTRDLAEAHRQRLNKVYRLANGCETFPLSTNEVEEWALDAPLDDPPRDDAVAELVIEANGERSWKPIGGES